MGEIEIELWTDESESDYARIISSLDDDTARELYQHLWQSAVEWTEKRNVSTEKCKRLTGKHGELANVLQWYEQDGRLEMIEKDGEIRFIPSESVQKALRVDSDSQVVLMED